MKTIWYNHFMNEGIILAKNLKRLRKKKGYTQAQLAEIADVSRRVIVHYENYIKKPVFENVKKIAEALDVSMDELVGHVEAGKTKKTEDASYKIMKKVRIIEKLPLRDQNAVFHFINSLAKKNKLEGKL
jgi:transcriptional regulator with XRE-family HTH domain